MEKVAVSKVCAALDLLYEVSPHQLERVARLLNGLTVTRVPVNLAAWQPDLAVAFFDRDFVLDPGTTPARVASLVIHELTHARLEAAGFRQATLEAERYERICYLAERNFIARLPRSHSQQALAELNQRYIDSLPWYFSESAIARRRADWRARQPTWRRIVYDVLAVSWAQYCAAPTSRTRGPTKELLIRRASRVTLVFSFAN
jgi:hypothetical protein